MATPTEIITIINNSLPTNGNNEITAAVLRPVLIAMVNQINELVGDEDDLPGGSDTVIEAINNQTAGTFTIHTGTDNPNTTPPSSFNLGDFYSQTVSSVIFAFWQYNGVIWVEILSREQQKIRNTVVKLGNYTLSSTDDTVIYNGTNTSNTLSLPDVTLSNGKIFTLVNLYSLQINTGTFVNLLFAVADKIPANSVLKIQSNGSIWQQINN